MRKAGENGDFWWFWLSPKSSTITILCLFFGSKISEPHLKIQKMMESHILSLTNVRNHIAYSPWAYNHMNSKIAPERSFARSAPPCGVGGSYIGRWGSSTTNTLSSNAKSEKQPNACDYSTLGTPTLEKIRKCQYHNFPTRNKKKIQSF